MMVSLILLLEIRRMYLQEIVIFRMILRNIFQKIISLSYYLVQANLNLHNLEK